ncbi:MAG: radical SAM protein [Planctomycetota bacterium]|jgi:heme b synthase
MSSKTHLDKVNKSPSKDAYPPLRLVFWETTAGCNLECVHCRRLEVSQELTKNDLSTEKGKQLIDQIVEIGRPVLVFSGGEPLMRPDIFELAKHAKAAGLTIALATNGTLIDDAMAAKIAAAQFDRVSVSLDGADSETHDIFRGLAGSFDQAVKGMRLLHSANVPVQVNCTIARHNQDQIEDLLKLAEGIGAVAVHYFLLVPVGCGQQIADEQMLDMNEVEERLNFIADLDKNTELQIKPTCAPQYYRIIRQQGKSKDERPPSKPSPGKSPLHSITKGCLAGTAVCFVSHEGNVFPCGYLPISAGEIMFESLGEIWRESSVFTDLRNPNDLTGKCGICEFKHVCSGCRARAFYQFGDYLAQEPYCAYEPKQKS